MSYFPIFLEVKHKTVVIFGGGEIALAKLQTILSYSNDIVVIAKKFNEQLGEFAKIKNIRLVEDEYHKKYLDLGEIIIGATNDFNINTKISQDTKNLNKLVNIVDNSEKSDFIFGAIVRRGNLQISVSTSGVSPVLSRLIKQKIEKILPNNLENLNQFIKANRQLVKDKLGNLQSRRLFWQELLESDILHQVLDGKLSKAQLNLEKKLNSYDNQNNAALYIIGAGPGDPELITIKAINLLSKADVILYDRLIADNLLEYARKDAIKISVGKTKDFHSYTQEQIDELIKKYLLAGKIVARLKGGDPTIFAHLYQEIDIAKNLDVSYQIVPGITAISGVASSNSISLTARNIAKSFRILTLYKQNLFDDSYWQNLATSEDTLVFYMSSHNASYIAKNLIKFGKDPQLKIAVISQATTPFQETCISTLENFEQQNFISPSIVIVGDVIKYAEKYASYQKNNKVGKFFKELKQGI